MIGAPMRFVYVMDPMDRVVYDKDTTFAIQRAAQRLGHASLHCTPRDVYVEGGDVWARVRPLQVSDAPPHFAFEDAADVRLADVDCVFVRKDPPFDASYLYLTQLLEVVRGRTLVVNDPRGLREANEKLYTLHFTRHMPKTLVSSDRDPYPSLARRSGHGRRQAARRCGRQRRDGRGEGRPQLAVDHRLHHGRGHAPRDGAGVSARRAGWRQAGALARRRGARRHQPRPARRRRPLEHPRGRARRAVRRHAAGARRRGRHGAALSRPMVSSSSASTSSARG